MLHTVCCSIFSFGNLKMIFDGMSTSTSESKISADKEAVVLSI